MRFRSRPSSTSHRDSSKSLLLSVKICGSPGRPEHHWLCSCLCRCLPASMWRSGLHNLPAKNFCFAPVQICSSLGQHPRTAPVASLSFQEAPRHKQSGKPLASHLHITATCLSCRSRTHSKPSINPNVELLLQLFLNKSCAVLEDAPCSIEVPVILLCQS